MPAWQRHLGRRAAGFGEPWLFEGWKGKHGVVAYKEEETIKSLPPMATPLLSLLDDTWITKNKIPQTGGPPDMPSGPVASMRSSRVIQNRQGSHPGSHRKVKGRGQP